MLKNIYITHTPNTSAEIADTLWDAYASKFNFGQMYLMIQKEYTQKFIDEISKKFKTKYFKFSFPSVDVHILESENIFIQIDERKTESDLFIFTMTREDLQAIFNIYLKYKHQDNDIKIDFEEITLQQQITSKIKTVKLEDISYLSEKYYPFLDAYKLIEQFLKGKENLLIIGGKPGTGKSKFISLILKWVIENEFKKRFLVSSAKDINLITMDAFWQKVENSDLLVLDDLDFMLGSRNESREDITKNNFVSKLLSFTDGVINNNTKIVITTNQQLGEIDDAILREGRIFDILEFRPLTKDEAKEILSAEGIDVDNIDLDETVLQSEVGSIIENYKNTGKIERDYLLEDVSLLHKRKTNSVGFI